MPNNPPNKTLGKYELLEELGRGGFGTVYRALDLALGREVALKILHPAFMADPNFIEGFRQEARRVAVLENANIVTVYDLDEAEGRFFIAMRYLPGGSLGDLLKKEGRIPYQQAVEILRQVAAGLQFAHDKSLIHRDVKPENILFSAEGEAVISDFGLAKAMLSSTSSASASSGGVGTPGYKAPEMWRGKPPASPATDVYSLACVFYEMITGNVLFNGDSPPEVMTRHMLDGPHFPDHWPEGVPHGFESVLRKALSQDPEKRNSSTKDFVNALQKLSGQVDPTSQISMPELGEKSTTKKRVSQLDHYKRSPSPRKLRTPDWAPLLHNRWFLAIFLLVIASISITLGIGIFNLGIKGSGPLAGLATRTLTPTITQTITLSPTHTPTSTSTPQPTEAPTQSPTNTSTSTPFLTQTPTPTATPIEFDFWLWTKYGNRPYKNYPYIIAFTDESISLEKNLNCYLFVNYIKSIDVYEISISGGGDTLAKLHSPDHSISFGTTWSGTYSVYTYAYERSYDSDGIFNSKLVCQPIEP